MKNRREIYDLLKKERYDKFVVILGHDRAMRDASIYAVQNTETEYIKQFKPDKKNIVVVGQVLDRSKPLEEAIFLAMCGLEACRAKSCITGVVRLEIAKNMLERSIAQIRKKMEK